MRTGSLTSTAIALTLAASALCACSPRTDYVIDGGEKTLVGIEAFAAEYDTSAWAREPASSAAELRGRALAAMRGQGGEAIALADVLTDGFAASRGVPVYAEEVSLDGRPVWVVVEVYGPDGGTLDRRRLWILSRPAGGIVSSSAYP